MPVDKDSYQVREVKIFRRALSKPSNFITTFFVGYFVFRILESYTTTTTDEKATNRTLEELRKKRVEKDSPFSEQWKKANEALKAGRKTETTNAEDTSSLSDSWKKAHGEIQRSNPASSTPQTVGDPPDVVKVVSLPPLGLWTRQKQSPMYTPEDQEYKDYVKLQSDEKKVADLRKQVTELVFARLKNPAHQANLRYIDFNGVVHTLFEIVPQIHPPPLYEVPALIIFKDGIGTGWKTLRPDVGSKLETVFHPTVTYAAAKAGLWVFFSASYQIAKAKLFGDDTPMIVKQWNHHLKYHVKQPNPVMSAKELEKDNAIPQQLPGTKVNPQSMQELLKAMHSTNFSRERHSELVKQLPLTVAVQLAAATFRKRQLVGLALHQQARTRGTLQVRGVMECKGNRGSYIVEVCAVYLPSEEKFVAPLLVEKAYIAKDYSACDKIEEKRKTDLQAKQSQKRQAVLEAKLVAEEAPETKPSKPPAGKEKE